MKIRWKRMTVSSKIGLVILVLLALTAILFLCIRYTNPASESQRILNQYRSALNLTDNGDPSVDYFFINNGTVPFLPYKGYSIFSMDRQLHSAKDLSAIHEQTKNFFASIGYTESTYYETDDDSSLYQYQKGSMACQVDFYENSDPFLEVYCGQFQKADYEKSLPFFNILNSYLASTTPPKFPAASISHLTQEGDFASGQARYADVEGFVWIMKKIDDTWQVIFTGNDIPGCALMEKYQVPKSIFGTCASYSNQ